jgi:hypothetical protein
VFSEKPIPNRRLRYANAGSEFVRRFVAPGEIFMEFAQRCFRVRLRSFGRKGAYHDQGPFQFKLFLPGQLPSIITAISLNRARVRPIVIDRCETMRRRAKTRISAGDAFQPHKPSMQKANQFALNNGLAPSPAASNRLSCRRSAERRGDYHVPQ